MPDPTITTGSGCRMVIWFTVLGIFSKLGIDRRVREPDLYLVIFVFAIGSYAVTVNASVCSRV